MALERLDRLCASIAKHTVSSCSQIPEGAPIAVQFAHLIVGGCSATSLQDEAGLPITEVRHLTLPSGFSPVMPGRFYSVASQRVLTNASIDSSDGLIAQ